MSTDIAGSAWLITDCLNQRYYHHLPMAAGAVYVSAKRTVFLDWSGRGAIALLKDISGEEMEEEQLGKTVKRLLEQDKEERLLVEESIPLKLYRNVEQALGAGAIVPKTGLVETLREQKNEWELRQLKRACEITDNAFAAILDKIRPGVTELEIAAELEKTMRLLGAEEPNKTIVAAGKNSAFPHHWPTDYVIQKGDFVTMDYGCVYNGYHSDLTRTVVAGKADDRQKHIYETVLQAQLAAIWALKAGKTGGELDNAARSIIENAGYAGTFLHNLGHGIGLSIHEGTGLVKNSTKVLKTDMVVSIEPGIYIENYGGVRIEDIAVVGTDGCSVLEHAKKELIEL